MKTFDEGYVVASRINSVELAGFDERKMNAGRLGSSLRMRPVPRFPSDHRAPEHSLGGIVVDGDHWVFEKVSEALVVLEKIRKGARDPAL